MRRSILVIAAFFPMVALGQKGEVPKRVLDELSSDLSALHKRVLEVQSKQQAAGPFPWFSDIGTIKVTKNFAEIHAGASKDAKGLFKASQGDTFTVIPESVSPRVKDVHPAGAASTRRCCVVG